ncbi:hypothetical protein SS50377_20960 [Spironucleus salmonicida]|uniref:Uncharacterized protein n=1 Tax=Spironucleus salmonicida TaxID=348837 RepID=V6LGE7_9EUKA|nr:hypothetical protein SS50377_20960 [Spironucleus salmonicida]|eukprot:EST43630.1 Hypothetical protein SS50377_16673 [Spironucleus salmonicida]
MDSQNQLYSQELLNQRDKLIQAAQMKPKVMKFEVLLPAKTEKEKQERQHKHKQDNVDFVNRNKESVCIQSDASVNVAKSKRQSRQELLQQVQSSLKIQKPIILNLCESDIFTEKINLADFLPLFKQPYDFKTSFQSYLDTFQIGEVYRNLNKKLSQTHHKAITFKQCTKEGNNRSQLLIKADSFNNQCHASLSILIKLCSGQSYIPLPSFKQSFSSQKESIQAVLELKFLNQNIKNGTPLFEIYPAGQAVDYLLFDQDQLKQLVLDVKNQLKRNIWEPFQIYQKASQIFKIMLKANPKAKGVETQYERSLYENILYRKLECQFVQMLLQRETLIISIQELIQIVELVKVIIVDQEVKDKIRDRQKNNISGVKIQGFQVLYTGSVLRTQGSNEIEKQKVQDLVANKNNEDDCVELGEKVVNQVSIEFVQEEKTNESILDEIPVFNQVQQSVDEIFINELEGKQNNQIKKLSSQEDSNKSDRLIPNDLPPFAPPIALPDDFDAQSNQSKISEALNQDISDANDSTSESKKRRKRRTKE